MKIRLVLGILYLVLSFLGFAQDEKNEPALSTDMLLKLASTQLPNYLEMVKKDNISNYGFYSEDEFSLLEFGEPMQVCYLSKDFYLEENYKDMDYLVFANEYKIPLLVSNVIRSFLLIGKVKEEWKVVGIGDAFYAKEVGKALKIYDFSMEERLALFVEPSSRKSFFIKNPSDKSRHEFYPVVEDKTIDLKTKKYSIDDLLPILHKQHKKENDEKGN